MDSFPSMSGKWSSNIAPKKPHRKAAPVAVKHLLSNLLEQFDCFLLSFCILLGLFCLTLEQHKMVSQTEVVMESQKSACSGFHRLFHLNSQKLFGTCHDLASRLLPNTKTPFLLKSFQFSLFRGVVSMWTSVWPSTTSISSLFPSRFGRWTNDRRLHSDFTSSAVSWASPTNAIITHQGGRIGKRFIFSIYIFSNLYSSIIWISHHISIMWPSTNIQMALSGWIPHHRLSNFMSVSARLHSVPWELEVPNRSYIYITI